MKGVIAAGGLGMRLRPLTLITNKHLLPVYDLPMIMYPLDTLLSSGVRDILIVCGKEHAGGFINFLGSGKTCGARISYALQEKDNAGIADALAQAEDFSDGEPVAVILGDNIFENGFQMPVLEFEKGAAIFLKKVPDPERFGVPVFDRAKKRILTIEEKPARPKSSYAQTGFYLFDEDVFAIIKTLSPSARGELEITDVVNAYICNNLLAFHFVKGFWSDAGTFDSLMEAARWRARMKKKETRKV